MPTISFDITFKKTTDKDSIKLSLDADFQQLKIMICGRYKLYDMNNIYIYYQGKNINPEEHTKLRNIFKKKKVQIEVKQFLSSENEEIVKYFCHCNNPATYICDVCNEYICNFCFNLKKHITHNNKIIKLSNYNNYLKISLRDNENLINKQIIKDDGYLFLEYLEYDINNEVKTINNIYEYAKNQLEEIKKMQINFILEFNKCNKYDELSQKIEEVVSQYTNINMDDNDLDNLIEEKNDIIKKTRDLLSYYDEIKIHLLYYTKNIKEIQNFNEGLIYEIKDHISATKKKFNQIPKITFKYKNDNISNSNKKKPQSVYNTFELNDFSKTASDFPMSVRDRGEGDLTPRKNDSVEKKYNSTTKKYKKIEPKKNVKNTNKVESPKEIKDENNETNEKNNSIEKNDKKYIFKKKLPQKKKLKPDRVLIRLKDESKFLIFSIENLSFKERFFIDRSNFVKEITSLNDIIQLNNKNILYMLVGKRKNKLFYYNYQINSIFYACSTLYSHNYGSMAYCPKNNSIYLIGGSQQKNCEICEIKDLKKLTWKSIPQLNEERQEFGTLCFNNYLYVFFGFNSIKNKHCNSIERLNVENHSKFETIYANKEIKISSFGCCKFNINDGAEEIMLLGGYNGEKFLDSTLIFMINEMKIREGIITIPNFDIHEQFLFYKESGFAEFDPGLQFCYDWKNNVHLLSRESYELFSEGMG